MNGQWSLDRFLEPDPRDVGCARTADLLDAYVELMLAGAEPAERYLGVAAHLADCDACHQDFTGLLEAVRSNSTGARSGPDQPPGASPARTS